MYDYHIHTTFSGDSTINPEECIQKAIELGIKEIAITDHAEFNVWRPGELFEDDCFNIKDYMSTLTSLKEKYGHRIVIKAGIEVGLQREEKKVINQLINENPFDFVIGSSHTIDKIDLFYRKIYEEQTKSKAYEQYFNEVLEIVRVFDSYSVYGHLDLIRRYAPGEYEDVELTTAENEIIIEILKQIISRGKGIEVNTSGYRYGLNSTNPGIEILKWYRQLGGEIITVGSDAHHKSHIGYRIPETYELLKDLGYRYITIFEQMNAVQIKL